MARAPGLLGDPKGDVDVDIDALAPTGNPNRQT
jgi:hypothetical protein